MRKVFKQAHSEHAPFDFEMIRQNNGQHPCGWTKTVQSFDNKLQKGGKEATKYPTRNKH